ncbi:threonine/serine exporter family protein [Companilactobacillus kimchiensis]|nr:threonine/serine exporter family protein [Companilactobacillus kimchiensis]
MGAISERDIVTLCGQVGTILLENGAETSRVENTVEYVGRAVDLPVICHATMTGIFVSSENSATTRIFKVRVGDFNLQKVDEINTLSREFSRHEITYDELKKEVKRVDTETLDFSWLTKCIGAGLVSMPPMLLFKATWGDLALAFFVGILGYVASQIVAHHTKTPYIPVAVGSLVISLLANVLGIVGIAHDANYIIISALMPLVPGVPMTNSLREIIERNTISGIVRATDAIMAGISIGSGVIVGQIIIKSIFGG